MDFVLSYKLRRLSAQLRAVKFHHWGMVTWGTVATAAAALALVQLRSQTLAPYAAPALLGVFVIAAVVTVWTVWRDRTGIKEAARYLEATYPELGSSLQAAIEQRPEDDGHFHFLQRRVIGDIIKHAEMHDWPRAPRREASRASRHV